MVARWLARLVARLGARAEDPGAAATAADVDDALPEVIEMPITDELDLHTFPPREVRDVVNAYLEEAHARGLRRVRIVHGKGKGVQRRIVRSLLNEHALVAGYENATAASGGWGATIVNLK